MAFGHYARRWLYGENFISCEVCSEVQCSFSTLYFTVFFNYNDVQFLN